MRIAVLGPGGIGGLLAALLARGRNSVEVLASETTSRVIAERGLRVESQRFGDFKVDVMTATRLERPVDACLVAVKNTQLLEALERIPAETLGDGLIVPFLNGIGNVDVLRGRYTPSSVTPATFRVATARVEPGVVRQTSPFASIDIAATAGNGGRVAQLAAQLSAVGLDVRVRDDEVAMLWDKLSFLAPLAILTTHEQANAGVIRTRRRAETVAVISEVAAVATAEGAPIDPAHVVRFLNSVPETIESSMQHDQAAGLPLELDAIAGAVFGALPGPASKCPLLPVS